MGMERKGKCRRYYKLRNYWINIIEKKRRFRELNRGKNYGCLKKFILLKYKNKNCIKSIINRKERVIGGYLMNWGLDLLYMSWLEIWT